jgi:hypothetical protein
MTKKGRKQKNKHVYIVEERNKYNIVVRKEKLKGQTLTKAGEKEERLGCKDFFVNIYDLGGLHEIR